MAENDSEVVRLVWESSLPVVFTLSDSEVIGLKSPDPFLSMVSRVSFFPLVVDKVVKHLVRFQSETNANDLWLDSQGIPLKWHLPIGLLYDLMDSPALPWTITVHFKDFPEDELIRCSQPKLLEPLFMSVIKESDFLKHRSIVVNAMQKKDSQQLWSGLVNDKCDQFWTQNRKLMDGLFRHIPVKFYPKSGTQHSVQRLVTPLHPHTKEPLLLRHLWADLLHDQQHKYSAVTHGVRVPMETPLDWMARHLAFPDNFVHLCAVANSE